MTYALTAPVTVTFTLLTVQAVIRPAPSRVSVSVTELPTVTTAGSTTPALITRGTPPIVIEPFVVAVALTYALTAPVTVTLVHRMHKEGAGSVPVTGAEVVVACAALTGDSSRSASVPVRIRRFRGPSRNSVAGTFFSPEVSAPARLQKMVNRAQPVNAGEPKMGRTCSDFHSDGLVRSPAWRAAPARQQQGSP